MNEEKEMKEEASPKTAASPTGSPGGTCAEDGSEVKPGPAAAITLPGDLPAAYQKAMTEKLELYDRLLRKQAELDNFRKRVQREKEDFLLHANTDLIRSLLPVLDGFERALRHRDPKVEDSFAHGVELIHQELLTVLGRAGVTPIEAAGQTFDPHLHQAVETVESKEHRDQEVVEELQRGYKLKNRLLRPAIVKVASASKKR
ncbi:MAG TPA: nucleotide exchange factor GrpE [Terriglobia bacterium]|nr:nucleotide exchange factor GrpE [Terriglobia bacterium]